ncbi:MAG: hypothetical protein WC744_00310 [Patescibacteria group bacterium]|jgi:replication-associated recombination protein RarA
MIPLLILSKDSKLIHDYVDKLKVGSLFFEITPSTKEYSIDDIKNLIKETKIYNPKVRIYYLENFHHSSIPAQNSFLKLLEEPPSNVQFVLTTDNKNNLLPTIVSRTKIVKLQENNKRDDVEKFVFDETKLSLANYKITDKESAHNLLLQLINYFRERLDTDKKSTIIIREILSLNRLLESNNLNPQLTVDQALIFIWKKYNMK